MKRKPALQPKSKPNRLTTLSHRKELRLIAGDNLPNFTAAEKSLLLSGPPIVFFFEALVDDRRLTALGSQSLDASCFFRGRNSGFQGLLFFARVNKLGFRA